MKIEAIHHEDYDIRRAIQTLVDHGLVRIVDLGSRNRDTLSAVCEAEFMKDEVLNSVENVFQINGRKVMMIIDSPTISGLTVEIAK